MEGPDAAAPADRLMSPLHGRHGSTANQALSSRDESQGDLRVSHVRRADSELSFVSNDDCASRRAPSHETGQLNSLCEK